MIVFHRKKLPFFYPTSYFNYPFFCPAPRYVCGSGFAPYSLADGEGLKKALLGKDARFTVLVRDHLNESRSVGGDPVKVLVAAPDKRPTRTAIQDGHNGRYRVIWCPSVEGEHIVSVTIKVRGAGAMGLIMGLFFVKEVKRWRRHGIHSRQGRHPSMANPAMGNQPFQNGRGELKNIGVGVEDVLDKEQ